MTTKPGRLSFSEPRPKRTQDPTEGKPARGMPVFMWRSAGEWLLDSAWHPYMKAMSSTRWERCGKSSDIHVPDSPCCVNLKGDFMSGPTSAGKKPVSLSKPS